MTNLLCAADLFWSVMTETPASAQRSSLQQSVTDLFRQNGASDPAYGGDLVYFGAFSTSRLTIS